MAYLYLLALLPSLCTALRMPASVVSRSATPRMQMSTDERIKTMVEENKYEDRSQPNVPAQYNATALMSSYGFLRVCCTTAGSCSS